MAQDLCKPIMIYCMELHHLAVPHPYVDYPASSKWSGLPWACPMLKSIPHVLTRIHKDPKVPFGKDILFFVKIINDHDHSHIEVKNKTYVICWRDYMKRKWFHWCRQICISVIMNISSMSVLLVHVEIFMVIKYMSSKPWLQEFLYLILHFATKICHDFDTLLRV